MNNRSAVWVAAVAGLAALALVLAVIYGGDAEQRVNVVPGVEPNQDAPYFGQFLDELNGTLSSDGNTFHLTQEFRYLDPNDMLWTVEPGVQVDGASIPRLFWSFIGSPWAGRHRLASVVHDHYCNTRTRTAYATHRSFYNGMRANGVEVWRAKFMYWAVLAAGPDWDLQFPGGFQDTLTDHGRPQDMPQSMAYLYKDVLLSKATAVARTLKTSGGKYLDVDGSGRISAELDEIDAQAEPYRRMFRNLDPAWIGFRDWSADDGPVWIGLMAWPPADNLDQIKHWGNGVVPDWEEVPTLARLADRPRNSDGLAFRVERSMSVNNSVDILARFAKQDATTL